MVSDGGNDAFGQKFLPSLSKESWSHNNNEDMAPVGEMKQTQGRVQDEVDSMDLVFSETGLQGANLKCMDTRSAEKTEWWDRLSHFFWENSVTGTVSEVPVH